ncbi:MAG: chemotaxis response regulator protein-glutamate methylesterase [Desulfuromonadales bacterium]|nr:chemotaxis response regulator protein-glutamate methylesterase [Desulfuromonadales bacterium]
MTTDSKVRVLVVDDSAFNRRTIVKILESLPSVEVIGYACDGEEGLRKTLDLRPDLITLDLEMPRMDGFTLLRIIMQKQPTPIIVVSSRSGDEDVFKALELGAIEFVTKPTARVTPALMDIEDELLAKVREVAKANLQNVVARSTSLTGIMKPVPKTVKSGPPRAPAGTDDMQLVVIGASTGGPPALQTLFSSFQEKVPVAFAVAQHMPPDFTKAFAERMNRFSALDIYEARDGQALRPGEVLIAPGGCNLEIARGSQNFIARVCPPEPRQRYTPSVDRLFQSAAPLFGPRLLGVVLTGMGNDGAAGTRRISECGGTVFAEAEQSCVVFGMPKEAIATGLVRRVVPLPEMFPEVLRHCLDKARPGAE